MNREAVLKTVWNLFLFGCAGCFLLLRLFVVTANRGFSCGARARMSRLSGCPDTRGIFLNWVLNTCPLYWQSDSQLLDDQGNPKTV